MKKLRFILIISVVVFFSTIEGCRSKSRTVSDITPKDNNTMMDPEPVEPKTLEQEILTKNRLEEITKQLQPIFFDFDRAEIRKDQVDALHNNSTILKQFSDANLLLEGHCDERGTEEYNLALGERRANAVKNYLVDLGVDEKRIQTMSYGESRPFALDHDENAWRQNRRGQPVAVAISEGESSK